MHQGLGTKDVADVLHGVTLSPRLRTRRKGFEAQVAVAGMPLDVICRLEAHRGRHTWAAIITVGSPCSHTLPRRQRLLSLGLAPVRSSVERNV